MTEDEECRAFPVFRPPAATMTWWQRGAEVLAIRALPATWPAGPIE